MFCYLPERMRIPPSTRTLVPRPGKEPLGATVLLSSVGSVARDPGVSPWVLVPETGVVGGQTPSHPSPVAIRGKTIKKHGVLAVLSTLSVSRVLSTSDTRRLLSLTFLGSVLLRDGKGL